MAHMETEPLDLFLTVCKKPRMYLQSERYESVCAFIEGYDMALQGAPLVVFREWLLTKGDEWNNMPWRALVRKIADTNVDLAQPPSAAEDAPLRK
jgi:hypothetical protein